MCRGSTKRRGYIINTIVSPVMLVMLDMCETEEDSDA